MNFLSAILNLFKGEDGHRSEEQEQRLGGYRAFERGNELYGRNQHKEALVCFDKAISLGFEDAELLGTRGSCLQLLDFHLDAIDDFDKAISLDPENTHLYFMRSHSKTCTGDLHGGIADLHEAIRVAGIDNPGNRAIHQLAREHGFKDVVDKYQTDLVTANWELERVAMYERAKLERPTFKTSRRPKT